MTRLHDRQRGRVYAWEDRFIAPEAKGSLSFAESQRLVDAIWRDLGLQFPPRVEPMPRQARRRLADASRLCLRLPPSMPYWVFLHEVAHALSSTEDGSSDGHGPAFMGLYVQLLHRYLRFAPEQLLVSLAAARIEINPAARPAFLDKVADPR